jgi:hypothetical protein
MNLRFPQLPKLSVATPTAKNTSTAVPMASEKSLRVSTGRPPGRGNCTTTTSVAHPDLRKSVDLPDTTPAARGTVAA